MFLPSFSVLAYKFVFFRTWHLGSEIHKQLFKNSSTGNQTNREVMANREEESLIDLQQHLTSAKQQLENEKSLFKIQRNNELQELQQQRDELNAMRQFLKHKEEEASSMMVLTAKTTNPPLAQPEDPTITSSNKTKSKSKSKNLYDANPNLKRTAKAYFGKQKRSPPPPPVSSASLPPVPHSTSTSTLNGFTNSLLTTHLAQKTSSQLSLISLLSNAGKAEAKGEHTQALHWYNATLAFMKASDPNELELSPLFRAHMGSGAMLHKLHRLDEAETSYTLAVKLSHQDKDKKGLEQSANKLGNLLIEMSEMLESQGHGEEAYVALQRGIASLQEAIEGGADFLFDEDELLSETEKLIMDDQKVMLMIKRNKGLEMLEQIEKEVELDKKGSENGRTKKKTKSGARPTWKPTGRSEGRKNLTKSQIFAGDMVTPDAPLNSNSNSTMNVNSSSLSSIDTNTSKNTNTNEESSLTGTDTTATTFTNPTKKQKSKKLSPNPKTKSPQQDTFGTIRSGRHLFVRRGCSLDYEIETRHTREEIHNAAVTIQGMFRKKLAKVSEPFGRLGYIHYSR